MPITQETLSFLVENHLRDSRTWYQEHKADYQKLVMEPLVELVEQLTPAMLEIDPLFVTAPKVDKTISRIYRDTRFSKDKTLYREVVWCVFSRDKKKFYCPPGFVLEFSPNGFRYGCGYYQAPPKVMEEIRQMVLRNDPAFALAQEAYEKQDEFLMEGDSYKRSKYPDQPEHLRHWLDRKGIAFMKNSMDFQLLFSPELAQCLIQGFRKLVPMYSLFLRAEERVRLSGERE